MTISAPQGQRPMPLSEGKRARLDETMEEVGRPAIGTFHSKESGLERTGKDRNGASSAPLHAPRGALYVVAQNLDTLDGIFEYVYLAPSAWFPGFKVGYTYGGSLDRLIDISLVWGPLDIARTIVVGVSCGQGLSVERSFHKALAAARMFETGEGLGVGATEWFRSSAWTGALRLARRAARLGFVRSVGGYRNLERDANAARWEMLRAAQASVGCCA